MDVLIWEILHGCKIDENKNIEFTPFQKLISINKAVAKTSYLIIPLLTLLPDDK